MLTKQKPDLGKKVTELLKQILPMSEKRLKNYTTAKLKISTLWQTKQLK